MAVVENVESLILLADGYLIELQGQRIDEQKKGCSGDGYLATMEQIVMLKEQLLYQIEIEDMGERTDKLYSCLLLAVENYSGASISVDPNSSTSGNTIIIENPLDNRPSWFDFYWDEMTDEDGDGARYVYTNPILDGWNPSLQTGTTLLYLGVDYDMYAGGIIKLRSGKGIYDGQSIRADNFQPYDAPIMPPVITVQPETPIEIEVGDDLELSVTATGADTYQWALDGVDIVGATESTYTKLNAQESDSGTYTVTVCNEGGCVTSDDAVVSVEPVVEVGVALIQNNSSQSINYSDNFGSLTALPAGEDYFKDPIIDDQSMYLEFPNGTTMTYTVYNSDGSVFTTLTLNAPPSTGFTSANMLLTKRYEFIITNT